MRVEFVFKLEVGSGVLECHTIQWERWTSKCGSLYFRNNAQGSQSRSRAACFGTRTISGVAGKRAPSKPYPIEYIGSK